MQRSLPYLAALALGFALPQGTFAQQAPDEDAPAIGDFAPEAEQSEPASTDAEEDATAPEPPAPTEEASESDAPPTDTDEAAGDDEGETAPGDEETDGAPAGIGEMPGAELPAGGEVVVRDTFGDWDVRCAEDEGECALHQLGLDSNENPVIEFSLFRAPEAEEAAALVNILTPLGTFLPGGLTLQIDSGETRQYGFTFCSAIGCIAQIALTDETIAAMRRGRSATVALASVTAPDKPVEISLSLIGFTDGFNSIEPAE